MMGLQLKQISTPFVFGTILKSSDVIKLGLPLNEKLFSPPVFTKIFNLKKGLSKERIKETSIEPVQLIGVKLHHKLLNHILSYVTQ